MKKFAAGFREFLMRGNVLDLAVAVVVGAAFTAVVKSFAEDILLQLVAAVAGKPNFNELYFTLHESQIRYGAFFTVLVNFVIVAFAVYLAVFTFEKMQEWRKAEEEQSTEPTDVELLTEIRDLLRAQGAPEA